MYLKPSESLSQKQISSGLNLVIKEGMATEAMSALTSGAFLVAMALQLGASNFQIGLLAALPTLTNIFQLLAIRLVQRFNNRRAIAVLFNMMARLPLLVIGFLPLLFSTSTSIKTLIFFLFFHYVFGSIAGASWNSWMKDLVPEQKLGSYFSQRTRLTQSLNVVLSLALAIVLDYVKNVNPQMELTVYGYMFIGGGLLGLLATYLLARTPEPASFLPKENLVKLFSRPLKNRNFRNLLLFNSFWSFALNLATPFFTVYMMKTLGLSLSYIIVFAIMSQLAGIFAVKIWGKHSDSYSNKTIIRIAAPVYIFCILAWPFVSMPSSHIVTILFIGLINILSGISTSGINLALNNIGIKLAPKDEAIVYLSAKNILIAFISALGPLLGGYLADYFSNRSFTWNMHWNGPKGTTVLRLFELHNFSFLFVIGGLLAFVSLRALHYVKENGEIAKEQAMAEMRLSFRSSLREKIKKEAILSLLLSPVYYPIQLRKKIRNRIENRFVELRKRGEAFLQKKSA